jgi:LPXTG-motif cell wall-anchored protein
VEPTVITTSTTAAPTTTAEDEVLDTEVLPFTGGDNDMLALLAGGLGLLGALVLASTRRMEEN